MNALKHCHRCGRELPSDAASRCSACGALIEQDQVGGETLVSSDFGMDLSKPLVNVTGESTLADVELGDQQRATDEKGESRESDPGKRTVSDAEAGRSEPVAAWDRTIVGNEQTFVVNDDLALSPGSGEAGSSSAAGTVFESESASPSEIDRTVVGAPDRTMTGTGGSGDFEVDAAAAQVAGQWARTVQEGGATILTSLKQPESFEDEGEGATLLSVQTRRLIDRSDAGPQKLGDYELLQKLGEGGMGVVYAARQASIDRVVAVKMLKASGAKLETQRTKFLAEAAVTGELEHPNIVPIYDLGKNSDGALFYSMRRVQGTPWNRRLKSMSLEENLDVLLRVADAVAFAHDRGVVHRDLKPENVMLGGFGEVLVMDWGLAMPVGRRGAGGVELKPSMGGTPAYMAPEMATGPFDAIGFPADIYLLGAMLYEIVTGRPPHHGSTVMKCLLAAARNEIVPTESRSELVEVARRAMQTDPEERYPTVQAFQRAIRDYREHAESILLSERAEQDLQSANQSGDYTTFARSVFAFQESLELWNGNIRAAEGLNRSRVAYARTAMAKGDLDLAGSLLDREVPEHEGLLVEIEAALHERETRVRRLAVLKRTAVGLAAAMFLVVSVALIWVLDANSKERVARSAAEKAREAALLAQQQESEARLEAEAAQRETAESLVREEEQRRIAEDNEKLAESAAEEALQERMAAEVARAEAEQARDSAIEAAESERIARAAADEARRETELALMREAEQRGIAEKSERKAVAARDEAERQRELARYEAYVARINAAASKIEEQDFDQARALLSECVPAEIDSRAIDYRDWEWRRLWYLCHRSRRDWNVSMPVEAICFSPRSDAFALGGDGERLFVYAIDGTELAAWKVGGTKVVAIDWVNTERGEFMATADDQSEGAVKLWEPTTGTLIRRLEDPAGHEAPITSIDVSRDGRWLATSSYDRTIKLWNLETGKVERTFAGHRRWVWSVRFSEDQRHLVTASEDGTVRVWETETGESFPPFLGHEGPVYTAAFSGDSRWIASAGIDGLVLQWAWDRESLVSFDHRRAVKDFSEGRPVEARTLRGMRILDGHTAAVRDLRFGQREGREVLVTTGHDHTIRTWSVETGSELSVLQGHGRWVRSCDMDAEGNWIVSGGDDGSVRLWEAAQEGETQVLQARRLRGHDDAVLAALFDTQGRRVITAGRDRTVREWDEASGSELAVYREGHAFLSQRVAALVDGERFVTSAVDGTTRIWSLSQGAELGVLKPTGRSAVLSVTEEGERIATGDEANGVSIWNSQTGALVARGDTGFDALPTSLAFDARGKRLLVGDQRGQLSLLQADSERSDRWSRQSSWRHHTDRVSDVIWLDEARFVSFGRDHTAALWRLDQEEPVKVWGHGEPVIWGTRLAGERVLTLGVSGTLRVWSESSDRPELLLEPRDSQVVASSGAISFDGRRGVVIDERNGRVLRFAMTGAGPVWDESLGVEVTEGPETAFVAKPGSLGEPAAAAFTRDDTSLLVVGGDAATLYDLEGASITGVGAVQRRFQPQGSVGAIAVSGRWLATGSWDGSVWIWDRESGLVREKQEGEHRGRLSALGFDVAGEVLVSADDRGKVLIRSWDPVEGRGGDEPVRVLLESNVVSVTCLPRAVSGIEILLGTEAGEVIGLDFAGQIRYRAMPAIGAVRRIAARHDAEGTLLGLAGGGGKAVIWSLEDDGLVRELPGHSAAVNDLAWSADGRRLLTGSDDFTVKLWDSATGKELLTLRGHDREVTSVGFDATGRDVLSAGLDGSAILWRSDTSQP